MPPRVYPPLIEVFLLVEQPRQRLSHWTRALAPLDEPSAPPMVTVDAYYEPSSGQAIFGVRYNELALGPSRLSLLFEVTTLAEITIIQPAELSEGDRKRFVVERLARCTEHVANQRKIVGALVELVRRVRGQKPSASPVPPTTSTRSTTIPIPGRVRNEATETEVADVAGSDAPGPEAPLFLAAKGTRQEEAPLAKSLRDLARGSARQPKLEREPAESVASPEAPEAPGAKDALKDAAAPQAEYHGQNSEPITTPARPLAGTLWRDDGPRTSPNVVARGGVHRASTVTMSSLETRRMIDAVTFSDDESDDEPLPTTRRDRPASASSLPGAPARGERPTSSAPRDDSPRTDGSTGGSPAAAGGSDSPKTDRYPSTMIPGVSSVAPSGRNPTRRERPASTAPPASSAPRTDRYPSVISSSGNPTRRDLPASARRSSEAPQTDRYPSVEPYNDDELPTDTLPPVPPPTSEAARVDRFRSALGSESPYGEGLIIGAPEPGTIYARYLRDGRWMPVRIGALSLRRATLMAGALPRLDDHVDVALIYMTHRAVVRGAVHKVSTRQEAATSGAATFTVSFELDDSSRRELTVLLTAARAANVTIKPPPPRSTRRYPVEWPICLGTGRGAVRAEALDVSNDGMFVKPLHALAIDASLTFTAILDDGLSPVSGRSRVVRNISDSEAQAAGLLSGYGLNILEMAEPDRARWCAFLARIEKRAGKRVLIGASPARLVELQGGLLAAGYAVTGGTDAGAIAQLASADARPVDAALIDAAWISDGPSASWIESVFSVHNVPCVTIHGDARRARIAIDRLLAVV